MRTNTTYQLKRARLQISTQSYVRRTVLILLISSFLITGASAVQAGPESELDPGEGFDIATFFDLSGDGVADADNPLIQNTP